MSLSRIRFKTYYVAMHLHRHSKYLESHQQDPGTSGEDTRRVPGGSLDITEEMKYWADESRRRVLEKAKGENITQTETRRRQLSELLDAGLKASKVGAIMDCSPSTIFKIIKMKKEGKSLAPNFGGGRPRSARTEENVAKANAMRAANPDITLSEMARKFDVSRATVARMLGHKDD